MRSDSNRAKDFLRGWKEEVKRRETKRAEKERGRGANEEL